MLGYYSKGHLPSSRDMIHKCSLVLELCDEDDRFIESLQAKEKKFSPLLF